MKMKKMLLAALAAAAFAAPAHALRLDSSVLNGNLIDTSLSTDTLFALDLTLQNSLPVSFDFVIEAEDIARGSVDVNGVIREVAGLGIAGVSYSFSGAAFELIPGSLRAATADGDLLTGNLFGQGRVTELYIGNPFVEDGLTDWTLVFANASAGDRFSLNLAITPAVPEPREWMMMLAGLGMIGVSAARRIWR
ncbi:hypothetical protein [Methyloversatilis thermotolerans]|uniref:hypothetical protein n=1 Tax=Methyloversatilis thermotolerans TaxID=1346290 RepID=UPI0003770B4D|nr:hypothetical protein [Methyloversatilis thermotolerans]